MNIIKTIICAAIGAFFIFAGTSHFTDPAKFMAIVPAFLPAPLMLVYVSGFFEILGGVGLWIHHVRFWAGWGLITLLVAVFPANINMAVNRLPFGETHFSDTALWLRLQWHSDVAHTGVMNLLIHWCIMSALKVLVLVLLGYAVRRGFSRLSGDATVFVCSALYLLFVIAMPNFRCGGQSPVLEYCIPGACLVLILILFRSHLLRWGATGLLILVAAVLAAFIQCPDKYGPYASHPLTRALRRETQIGERWKKFAAETLRNSDLVDKSLKYEPGWLSDLPLIRQNPSLLGRVPEPSHVTLIQPLWHTTLTGIYALVRVPAGLWYPGGQFDKALNALEIRKK